ncbi:hypothetical protein KM911_20215 [Bacillus paralicheniformis]|uniref:hypothetical protein n=1 Tax=Bacillus TaxID=1386 RepID=UPI0011EC795B|nr:hypothetical protein [Bacillus paralicheniformis]KAA0835399.1 hypothetical protein EI977_16740 [Bacillus paralicheniformis]KAA0844275.1 hypothetical protein EI979_00895 [Bacillus paralicheniformis]MBU8584015.1 hypothetical protein [Bacillus paralicheniformis]MCB6219812.1 hypothetical protein [Bacillus paralicheniformis]MCY8040191.1 hypothetical protein [Bacillus paralicheniformis]
MKVHTGLVGIFLIVLGLLISAENHQSVSAADALSDFFRLPVRNLVVLICMLMLIIGFIMAWRHYYEVPWIRFKLFLFIIGISVFYPLVTEQLMLFQKWNAQGDDAVEYMKKRSTCSYQSDMEEGNMDCEVKVNNYGKKTERIQLIPDITSEFDFQPEELELSPHSQETYSVTFKAPGNEDVYESGIEEEPRMKVEVVK